MIKETYIELGTLFRSQADNRTGRSNELGHFFTFSSAEILLRTYKIEEKIKKIEGTELSLTLQDKLLLFSQKHVLDTC